MEIIYIPWRGISSTSKQWSLGRARILTWRVSIKLGAGFYIKALEKALAEHCQPELFNSGQGSQFTSIDFIEVLTTRMFRISIGGKAAWRDNVFFESMSRSIKYEKVHLRSHPVSPKREPESAST